MAYKCVLPRHKYEFTPSLSQRFCQLRLYVCVGEWSRWPRSRVVYIYRQVTWPQVPWKLHICSVEVAPGVSCREVHGVPTGYTAVSRAAKIEKQVVQMPLCACSYRMWSAVHLGWSLGRLSWTYSCRPVRRNGHRPPPSLLTLRLFSPLAWTVRSVRNERNDCKDHSKDMTAWRHAAVKQTTAVTVSPCRHSFTRIAALTVLQIVIVNRNTCVKWVCRFLMAWSCETNHDCIMLLIHNLFVTGSLDKSYIVVVTVIHSTGVTTLRLYTAVSDGVARCTNSYCYSAPWWQTPTNEAVKPTLLYRAVSDGIITSYSWMINCCCSVSWTSRSPHMHSLSGFVSWDYTCLSKTLETSHATHYTLLLLHWEGHAENRLQKWAVLLIRILLIFLAVRKLSTPLPRITVSGECQLLITLMSSGSQLSHQHAVTDVTTSASYTTLGLHSKILSPTPAQFVNAIQCFMTVNNTKRTWKTLRDQLAWTLKMEKRSGSGRKMLKRTRLMEMMSFLQRCVTNRQQVCSYERAFNT